MSIRVRFAPSPTGDLHVGGARTALFNWLMARKSGGTFILRVEDTDGARNTTEASAGILKGLRWLGLDWDEGPEAGGDNGPYYQSQRKHIYDAYFEKLEAAGRVYAEDNGAMRFKFSRTAITVHDLVCGDVTFAPTEEPDMTIRRPDGSYIFHFVNVVDDIEMKMTHVIRGEDHLSNTWKHIDLFNAFGATPPTYAHIPLILNPDSTKMSKRDEGSAIEHSYMNGGYLPDAVFNYLCLLGWTPKTEAEKLSRQQLVELFEPTAIHSSNAKFDPKKAQWFNAQYLRELSPADLLNAGRRFLSAAGLTWEDDAMAAAAVHSVKEKVSLLTEIPEWVHYFFREDYPFEADVVTKLKAKPENAALLKTVADQFSQTAEWTEQSVHDAVEATAKAAVVKPGALMPLLRFALSGQSRGPGVTTIAHLIGREKTVSRIQRALAEQFQMQCSHLAPKELVVHVANCLIGGCEFTINADKRRIRDTITLTLGQQQIIVRQKQDMILDATNRDLKGRYYPTTNFHYINVLKADVPLLLELSDKLCEMLSFVTESRVVRYAHTLFDQEELRTQRSVIGTIESFRPPFNLHDGCGIKQFIEMCFQQFCIHRTSRGLNIVFDYLYHACKGGIAIEVQLTTLFVLLENLKHTFAIEKGYPFIKGYFRKMGATSQKPGGKLTFKELLETMLSEVGMSPNMDRIIKLRNELIHSGLMAISMNEKINLSEEINDIVREYILRLLRFRGQYNCYSLSKTNTLT